MVIYTKNIETEDFKKLTALLTKCRISEDVINNVLAGNIKVKNQKAYDRIYKELISDTIAFEKELEKVKVDIIGEDVIVNGLYFHVFSSRTKLVASIDDELKDDYKADLEAFLLRKGFEKSEIR